MQLPPFNPQTIAELFLELYTLLIRLSYLDPARLLLPPHSIPAAVLTTWSSKMDPVALDLIQRLPYVRGVYPVMLAPGAKSKNVAFHLNQAQDPMELGEEAEEYVEKWCVCLTDGSREARAGWWVLDTRKNMITKAEWENPYGQPEGTAEYSYDWQESFPAEDFLRAVIKRFNELEWIPWSGLFEWEGEVLEADGPDKSQVPHYHAMKALYQTYGWPDEFRKEEFTTAREEYIVEHKQLEFERMDREGAERRRQMMLTMQS